MTNILSLVPPTQGTIPFDLAETGQVAPLTLDMSAGADFSAQVQAHLGMVAPLSGVTHHIAASQPLAAILAVAGLDRLAGRLPNLALVPFRASEVSGWLNAAEFRHDRVRSRRNEFCGGTVRPGYTVVDGADRGLTHLQRTQLASKLGCPEADIRLVPAPAGQVDIPAIGGEDGVGPEAGRLLEGVISALKVAEVTWEEMTQGRVIYLPPGAGIVAVVQGLCLYGLTEAWPRTVRLAMTAPGQFEVAEIVDPQAMRLWADAQLRATAPVAVSRDLLARLIAGEEEAQEEARALLG